MKSSHRIASQHKRHMLAIASNPITRAVARAKDHRVRTEAAENFADQLLTTRIALLSTVDGEDATHILARLAVVIGTPCEAGARVHGHTATWVRQLHGALRTIQAMCLDGYRWQARYALAIDRAVEVAGEPHPELDPVDFQDAWVEACALATHITNHTVSASAIAA